jgi:hypothetical protein
MLPTSLRDSLRQVAVPLRIPLRGRTALATFLVAVSTVSAAAEGPAAEGAAEEDGPAVAVAVAPGSPERIVAVEGRCPTFHWGGEAAQWELAVFALGEDGAEAQPSSALRVRLPGVARGWTPGVGQCFEAGAYAWAVRAVTGDNAASWSESSWSPPSWSQPRYFAISDGRDRELLLRLAAYLEARGELEEALASEPGAAGAGVDRERLGARDRRGAGEPQLAVAADANRIAAASLGVGSGSAAVRGKGAFAGVVGSSDDPDGFGVGAMNLDPGGGADLVLDGSAQGLADTWLSESGLEAGGLQFELRNATSDLVLLLDGQPVVTAATDQDALGALACGDGELAKSDAGGAWSCAADEIGIAGNQLALDGATFDVVEGSGSGLDADLLDGLDESAFMRADTDEWVDTVGDTMTGDLVMSGADLDLGVGDGAIVRDGALFLHSRGDTNTAVGLQALDSATLGTGNTAVGFAALGSSDQGVGNTAVGVNALQSNQGGANTAIGWGSMFSNTGGFENTAVGEKTMQSNGTGFQNTALGVDAMRGGSGSRNTALGKGALRQVSGSDNLAVGAEAGGQIASGSHNVMIANPGEAADSGTIRIGGVDQTSAFLAGVYGVTVDPATAVAVMIDADGQLGTVSSSLRTKHDVLDLGAWSADLLALRPVSFRYRDHGGSGAMQFGLIAEEVAEVFPELVVFDRRGEPVTVKYHLLAPLLLGELQRLRTELDALREELSVESTQGER